MLAAIFPDFDFLAGMLVGNLHRFHHGISHSFAAALVFGAVAAFAASLFHTSRIRMAVISFLLYASHIVLDYFCYDGRSPYGVPLFWPFSSKHFVSPEPIFSGVRHGVPGDGFGEFLGHIVSWHNVWAVTLEAILLIPVLIITMFLRRRRYRAQTSGRAASVSGPTKLNLPHRNLPSDAEATLMARDSNISNNNNNVDDRNRHVGVL